MWRGRMANGFAEISFVVRSTSRSSGWVWNRGYFYSHRPDPERVEETMARSPTRFAAASALRRHLELSTGGNGARAKILRELGTPCLIHQRVTACWIAGWNRSCSRRWKRKASLHGFFTARKRTVDRPLFQRHPRPIRVRVTTKDFSVRRHHRRVCWRDESAETTLRNRAVRRWRRWRWHGCCGTRP